VNYAGGNNARLEETDLQGSAFVGAKPRHYFIAKKLTAKQRKECDAKPSRAAAKARTRKAKERKKAT
jgi:hypothetical protein